MIIDDGWKHKASRLVCICARLVFYVIRFFLFDLVRLLNNNIANYNEAQQQQHLTPSLVVGPKSAGMRTSHIKGDMEDSCDSKE